MNNSYDSDLQNSRYKKSKFSPRPEQDDPITSQEDYYTPQSQRGLLSPSYRQKSSSPTSTRDQIKKLTKPVVFIRRASNATSSNNTSERKSVRFSVYNDSLMSGAHKLDQDASKSFLSTDPKSHRNSKSSRMSKLHNDSNGSMHRKSVSSQHSSRSGIRKSRLQRIEEQVSESNSGNNSTLMDIQEMFYTNWDTNGDTERDEENNKSQELNNSWVNKKVRRRPNQESIKQVYYTMLKKKMGRRPSVNYEDDPEFTELIQMCKDGGYIPNNEKLRDLEIVDKTSLEKAKAYSDKYPLLSLRKAWLKSLKYVTYFCNKIIKHPMFEYFILAVIITNSILLAFDDPTTDEADDSLLGIMDKFFLVVYTLEMLLKIFGMGFIFSRNSYLRDAWNIMDFVIVVTAYIPLVVSSTDVGLQALRSLRVLRPLRTISNIEALRVLIGTLIAALGPLLDTLFIVFFLFVIFAIGGLQLFSGLMKKRCFAIDSGIPLVNLDETSSDFQQYCNDDEDCGLVNGIEYICGKMVKNPNDDVTNFDTIANSFLMVFQVVTLEGWSEMMLIIDKTFTPIAAIYFVLLIFLGAFFLLNLTLAVIKASFTDNSHKTIEETLESTKSYDKKLAERLREHQVDIVTLMNKKKEGILMYNKFLLTRRQVRAIEDRQAKKIMAERFRSKRRMATQQIVNQVKRFGGSFMEDLKKRFSFRPSFFSVVKQATEVNKQIEPKESRFQKAARSAKVAPADSKSPRSQEIELTPRNQQVSPTPSINLFLSPKYSPTTARLEFPSPDKNQLLARTRESEWRSPESVKGSAMLSPLGSPTSPSERKSLIPKKQNFLSIEYGDKSPENKVRDNRHSVFLMTPNSSTSLLPGVSAQDLAPKRSLMVAPKIEIASIKEVEDDELEASPGSRRADRARSNGTILLSDKVETLAEIGPRPSLTKKISLSEDKTGKKGMRIINIAGVVGSVKRQPIVQENKLIKLNKMYNDKNTEGRKSVQDDLMFFDLVDNQNNIQPENVDVQAKKVVKDPLMTRVNKVKALGLAMKLRRDSKKRKESVNSRKQSVSSRRKSKANSLDLTEEVDFDKKGSMDIPTALLNDSDFIKKLKGEEGQRQPRKRRTKKDNSHKSRREAKSSTKTSNTKQKSGSPKRGGSGDDAQIRSRDFDRRKGKGGSRNLTGSLGSLIEVEEEKKEPKFVVDVRHLKIVPKKRDYMCESVDDILPSVGENKRKEQDEKEMKFLRENRLPIEFKITKADEVNLVKINADRYDIEHENRQSSIAVRVSTLAKLARQKQKEEEDFDKEIGDLMQKQAEARSGVTIHSARSSVISSLNRKKSIRIRRKGNFNVVGGDKKVNDDDYLAPEKMKDYYEVLNRIRKPFENEKESAKKEHNPDVIEEGFNLAEEHKLIRRKDIEFQKIHEHNWSGDAIIPISKSNFPIKRAKLGLNHQERELWIPGMYGLYCEARRRMRQFTGADLFNNFIIFCVIFNTFILASEGLITDESTTSLFDDLNMAFTIIFIVEMGLKIFGFGIERYVNDTINLFDAAIVIISVVEWIFSSGGQGSTLSAFRAIRLFRTFRVLRVTKLLRSLAYMQAIIGVIMRSVKKFVYIAILLFLLIFIYALLGMQIFGGEFNYVDTTGAGKPRQNFDSFVDSFIAVFQIMTQENWQNILYAAMQSTANKPIALIYLVSWIFIGNYIFLNLFVAILLDEFTVEKVEEDLMEELEDDENPEKMSTRDTGILSLSMKGTFSKELSKVKSSTTADLESVHDIEEETKKEDVVLLFDKIRCDSTFYLFSKGNSFRIGCYKLVKHRYFDRTILAMIVISSIKLALDTYISSSDTKLNEISDIFDYIINVVFCLEAFFKIIAYGFVFDGNSYLRETWNVLDFIIVIASILDMSLENANLSFIRILRLLRTLRPLRFISHNQNMRLVVTALLESVGAIFNVVIVIAIIWLMFAILAVNIVGGKLGYCDNLPDNMTKYGIGRTECINMGSTWTNPDVNFDNVVNGMLSLFIVSTQEGWPDIMFTVVDSGDPEDGPTLEGNAFFGYIYFIVFLFVGSYFLLNLFVGVIFLKFLQAQKRENKLRTFLTPEQEDWVTIQRLILLVKPHTSFVEPETQWMKPFFKFVSKNSFDVFIIACILLNVVTMALTYEGASDSYTEALRVVNIVFSAIFFVEMVLKLLALGIKRYWTNNWNKFDAFVVVVSILDIILDFTQMSGSGGFLKAGPQIARVLRVLRVSRLIKLVKKFEGLQKIINTLVFSLPSLLNVGALLMLVYFIYAILATFLFGTIKEGKIIGGLVSFSNFSDALVTIFRASTGEDWFVIMFDTMHPISCTAGNSSCGTVAGAVLFWLSFIVICQFIFLNLFILVILQQFEAYYLNPDNPVNKFRDDLENIFKPTWEKFTGKHQGIEMPESQLIPFFQELPTPLGFKNTGKSKKEIAKEITQMNLISDLNSMLFYNDILFGIYKHNYGNEQAIGTSEYLLKEEYRSKRRLDHIRKKQVTTWKAVSKTLMASIRKNKASFNPVVKLLFLGMTMRAWMKYAKKTAEKMKAAKENEYEYISSGSDQEDYTYIVSNMGDSSDVSDEEDEESQTSQEEQDDREEENEEGSDEEDDESEGSNEDTDKVSESRDATETDRESIDISNVKNSGGGSNPKDTLGSGLSKNFSSKNIEKINLRSESFDISPNHLMVRGTSERREIPNKPELKLSLSQEEQLSIIENNNALSPFAGNWEGETPRPTTVLLQSKHSTDKPSLFSNPTSPRNQQNQQKPQ